MIVETQNPFELVAAFQRCMNYPKDELGVTALAQGLRRASFATGVAMDQIVQECVDVSQYCPTDAELLEVAKGLKGPPKAPDLMAEPGKFGPIFDPKKLDSIMQNGRRADENRAEMYRKMKHQLGVRDFTFVTATAMAWARRECGYPPRPGEETLAAGYDGKNKFRAGHSETERGESGYVTHDPGFKRPDLGKMATGEVQ